MKQPCYLSSCILLPQPLISCSASWVGVFYSIHLFHSIHVPSSTWQNSTSYTPSQSSPPLRSTKNTSHSLQRCTFNSDFVMGAIDCCCWVALYKQKKTEGTSWKRKAHTKVGWISFHAKRWEGTGVLKAMVSRTYDSRIHLPSEGSSIYCY